MTVFDLSASILGFVFIVIFAVTAYALGTLTMSATIGAAIVGSSTFLGFGARGFLLLLAFFVSSSILTRYRLDAKIKLGATEPEGDRRNLVQVLGQGLVVAVVAMVSAASPNFQRWLAVIFASAIASSTSDTWAAELGPLAGRPPRLITHPLQTVAHGTSGAVSILGELASVAGAVLISFVGFAVGLLDYSASLTVAIAGVLGSHVDSLAGASLQARFSCSSCSRATERTIHCGRPAVLTGGFGFVSNEAVNLIGTGVAAIAAGLLTLTLSS